MSDASDDLRRMRVNEFRERLNAAVDDGERAAVAKCCAASSDALLAAFLTVNQLGLMMNQPEQIEYARSAVYAQIASQEVSARFNAAPRTERARSPLNLVGPKGR